MSTQVPSPISRSALVGMLKNEDWNGILNAGRPEGAASRRTAKTFGECLVTLSIRPKPKGKVHSSEELNLHAISSEKLRMILNLPVDSKQFQEEEISRSQLQQLIKQICPSELCKICSFLTPDTFTRQFTHTFTNWMSVLDETLHSHTHDRSDFIRKFVFALDYGKHKNIAGWAGGETPAISSKHVSPAGPAVLASKFTDFEQACVKPNTEFIDRLVLLKRKSSKDKNKVVAESHQQQEKATANGIRDACLFTLKVLEELKMRRANAPSSSYSSASATSNISEIWSSPPNDPGYDMIHTLLTQLLLTKEYVVATEFLKEIKSRDLFSMELMSPARFGDVGETAVAAFLHRHPTASPSGESAKSKAAAAAAAATRQKDLEYNAEVLWAWLQFAGGKEVEHGIYRCAFFSRLDYTTFSEVIISLFIRMKQHDMLIGSIPYSIVTAATYIQTRDVALCWELLRECFTEKYVVKRELKNLEQQQQPQKISSLYTMDESGSLISILPPGPINRHILDNAFPLGVAERVYFHFLRAMYFVADQQVNEKRARVDATPGPQKKQKQEGPLTSREQRLLLQELLGRARTKYRFVRSHGTEGTGSAASDAVSDPGTTEISGEVAPAQTAPTVTEPTSASPLTLHYPTFSDLDASVVHEPEFPMNLVAEVAMRVMERCEHNDRLSFSKQSLMLLKLIAIRSCSTPLGFRVISYVSQHAQIVDASPGHSKSKPGIVSPTSFKQPVTDMRGSKAFKGQMSKTALKEWRPAHEKYSILTRQETESIYSELVSTASNFNKNPSFAQLYCRNIREGEPFLKHGVGINELALQDLMYSSLRAGDFATLAKTFEEIGPVWKRSRTAGHASLLIESFAVQNRIGDAVTILKKLDKDLNTNFGAARACIRALFRALANPEIQSGKNIMTKEQIKKEIYNVFVILQTKGTGARYEYRASNLFSTIGSTVRGETQYYDGVNRDLDAYTVVDEAMTTAPTTTDRTVLQEIHDLLLSAPLNRYKHALKGLIAHVDVVPLTTIRGASAVDNVFDVDANNRSEDDNNNKDKAEKAAKLSVATPGPVAVEGGGDEDTESMEVVNFNKRMREESEHLLQSQEFVGQGQR